jgi:selenocysteine-specific elongation factor
MIVATAGHVDHGKSLLVKTLTGTDPDRWAEEKQRGLTIDLGFAYQRLADGTSLGFVDVPGHIRFINNMLAGVTGIDFALLVIAADDGVMPQTREHLAILDLLGFARGCVALTKTDRASADRIDEVTNDLTALLASTSLSGIPVFPVSAITGEGIEALSQHLASVARDTSDRPAAGSFRLAIDRSFSVKGAGLVVTGTVFDGHVHEGDDLTLHPHRTPVRVRGIHRQNAEATHGQPGDRCAINLGGAGISRDVVHRGDWLSALPDLPLSSRVDAKVRVLATESRALRHWTPVHIHSAASHRLARVAVLGSREIAPGASGLVQIVCDEPLNVCHGDRIIIRDQAAARTLGGGFVLDPLSPQRGREREERIARLEILSEIKHVPNATQMSALAHAAANGINLRQLHPCFNQAPGDLPQPDDAQVPVVDGDDWAFAPTRWQTLRDAVTRGIDELHEQNPGATGSAPGAVQRHCRIHAPLFQAILTGLILDKKVVLAGSQVRLPQHATTLSATEQKLWDRLQPILEAGGTKPPVVHDIARQLAENPKSLDKSIAGLIRHGLVIRPVKNRFFLPGALEELRRQLDATAAQAPDGEFTAREYRDVTGIGRNLAIEILEYFDGRGVTQRNGDKRRLRQLTGS